MTFWTLRREALPTSQLNAGRGVFIMTNSITVSQRSCCSAVPVLREKGVSNAASSLPFAISKVAALRMMKAFAATQGPEVRVNAVLPIWRRPLC